MELVLEAVAVRLDHSGHIKARIDDCSEIALRMDGTEIDGIHFNVEDSGNAIEIIMKGDNLSDEIKTNYPAPTNSPISQVSFKSAEAKFTANTLNKFMYKAKKALKDRVVMIRSVKGTSE
jgi:2,3-bisphosphoglycerate-independent phosphoglycerate mutase